MVVMMTILSIRSIGSISVIWKRSKQSELKLFIDCGLVTLQVIS